MKQGKSLIAFVMAALAVVIAIYFGVYVFNSLNEPYRTTFAYTYTSYDSVEAGGLIVREELVFPLQSGIVELTRGEGEKVGVGQTVALVYQNSQAQADQTQIQALEEDIQLIEYAIAQSGNTDSAARLDGDVLQSLVELRSAAARGDYGDLEDQVRAVKSNVLKRGYTYGDGLTSADLNAQLRELNAQRTALTQRSAATTSRVTAKQSGVFSSLVDGYESLLTPAGVRQLTPSALDSLIKTSTEEGAGIGKLITSNRWYFVSNLPDAAAQRLIQGDSATLRFSGDFDQDVEMQVDQVGVSEGGRTLVVFSCDRYLSATTLLRYQRAELIFDSFSGLRIPKSALRLVEEESQPTADGSGTDSSASGSEGAAVITKLGVYALVNRRVEFKEVKVITEGQDYYVVRPVGTGKKILRAGDEIITQGTGLQNGQLLEY